MIVMMMKKLSVSRPSLPEETVVAVTAMPNLPVVEVVTAMMTI